jgi:hypothetical protein
MVAAMADNSPRTPGRKFGLIAPISIAAGIALVVLIALLLGKSRPQPPAPPSPKPVAQAPPPSEPPADPVVGRAELIASADALAAAYAANGPTDTKAPPPGRRFEVRLPFGCEGPQVRAGAAQAYYEYDAAKRTIRLVARPAVWTGLAAVQETTAADSIEAAEGFWIPQPWSPAEACPTPRDTPLPASPTPLPGETLGLVRLFTSTESRVGRRGERPYEQVVKLGENDPPPLFQGYRLVLQGRFASFPDGRVAHCWSESASHRPICLYAIALDRVAFETGDGKRTLAEWSE